jgi:hypothetical protein
MKLTEQQIQYGYWYYRPKENFPPQGKLLEEYNGEERLALCFTKGNETYGQIKKRESLYKSQIPLKLQKLKILWADQCNQETFNAICQINELESLYINSNSIRDLSALSNLKNLKHLGLLNMTKVESIKPISNLNQLQTLELEHFKKITDFSPVSELRKLQGLQIDGDMYTAQIIEDFDFLNPLTELKYLTFTKSRAKTKNFDSISKLANLEMIQCSTNYPKKEFQKLRGMKSLKYIGGNIKPLINNES